MADFINREAAIETVLEKPDVTPDEKVGIVARLNALHPADVRPVVRGKWKHDGSDWKNRFICDQCGYKWFFEAEEARFCPNCGADMRPEGRAKE